MPRVAAPAPGRPFAIIEPEPGERLDRLPFEPVVELYKQHGALLFSGFGCDTPALRDFAARFCSTTVVNDSPGRSSIDPDAQIYSVNHGNQEFALHPELSREPWKPDVAFFLCLSPPEGEGATTVCDGIELVRALPSAVRDGFAGRRLVYPGRVWPEFLEHWLGTANPDAALLADPPPTCPYRFACDGSGGLFRYFSRPALHKPMFGDDPAFGNFLLFARFTNGMPNFPLLDDMRPVPEAWLQAAKTAGDRLSARVDWRQGDLLMLDNTRFMHGRTAIANPASRLIATLFGYLRFAVPNPEEPADPVWRQRSFVPPMAPWHPSRMAQG
ncbi:TauD/TfdA family dioxygenase [Tsuneonella amylolytica]|uniref:TauD/TfdA family dioxygenase n=1 Tax=Tsuneonella amylolytica TaxID=2338327 RepID=UPI000EAA6BE0|nr:TauD/TfdA family dioxygenase [Tsuneonella amylolytica]